MVRGQMINKVTSVDSPLRSDKDGTSSVHCEPVRASVSVEVPPEGGAPPLRGDGDPDVGEDCGATELDVGEVAHEGGESVAARDEVHLLVLVQVPGARSV